MVEISRLSSKASFLLFIKFLMDTGTTVQEFLLRRNWQRVTAFWLFGDRLGQAASLTGVVELKSAVKRGDEIPKRGVAR
jgi:hypothetical protein